MDPVQVEKALDCSAASPVKLTQLFKRAPQAWIRFTSTSSNGFQVPLSQIAHLVTTNTALAVNHQDQFPFVFSRTELSCRPAGPGFA